MSTMATSPEVKSGWRDVEFEQAQGQVAAEEQAVEQTLRALEARRLDLTQRLAELRLAAAKTPGTPAQRAEVLALEERLAATAPAEVEATGWRTIVEARRAALTTRATAACEAHAVAQRLAKALELLELMVTGAGDLVQRAAATACEVGAQVAKTPAPAVEGASPPASQRRRDERVPLHTAVDLASDSNFFTGFTGDISKGGVFVATWAPLVLGSHVTLQLSLPTGQLLSLEGRVQWLRDHNEFHPDAPPGAGIAFVNAPADALAAIEAFVQRREAMFFPD